MNLRTFVLALAATTSLFAFDAAAQEADVAVTKSGPSTATAGSNVSFGITVTNFGPDDSAGASLAVAVRRRHAAKRARV